MVKTVSIEEHVPEQRRFGGYVLMKEDEVDGGMKHG